MYQYGVKTIGNKPGNTAIWVCLEVNLPDKIINAVKLFRLHETYGQYHFCIYGPVMLNSG